MTPDIVPEDFEQVMGCTVADLLRALPAALPGARIDTDSGACVINGVFDDGTLKLAWQPLPARRIALLEIPRLQVRFRYTGMTDARRREVQRRFDLATQRGGG
ncbi:MAG: hypothetical protein A3E25_10515 [Burkholderiales bacterium RIFCSPHIGHO2_12_FULL_69_20]|nr:MAG: hypothetical protein A3E25_10515 [Burkholderiales bacterium RIFCSPHIGHO2_12_FULL_69_20]